jgi:ferredoxin--NADP+ reductase
MAAGRASALSSVLVERELLGPTLGIFRLSPEGGVPDFEPGQFFLLGLPDASELVWRAYSVASPPEERRLLEFFVRWAVHPQEGAFTTLLGRLALGDPVLWRGPKGHFTVAPDERRLVLVAAGTGVAPFVSTVKHLQASGSTRDVVLCHGASYADELGYRAYFEELAAASARFRYLPTVSRPLAERNAGWRGASGRVHELLAGAPSPYERLVGEPLAPETCVVHVCGFQGTVDAALAVLRPLGFRDRRAAGPEGRRDVEWESYG